MSELTRHAAWILLITFALSLLYELYRATIKAGVSRHDSLRTFLSQGLPLYGAAAIAITTLFAGFAWAAWVGLVFAVALILMSIFYYNPRIMLERQPGMIDWFEDLVYTGLLFVAAALLFYDVLGKTLVSRRPPSRSRAKEFVHWFAHQHRKASVALDHAAG